MSKKGFAKSSFQTNDRSSITLPNSYIRSSDKFPRSSPYSQIKRKQICSQMNKRYSKVLNKNEESNFPNLKFISHNQNNFELELSSSQIISNERNLFISRSTSKLIETNEEGNKQNFFISVLKKIKNIMCCCSTEKERKEKKIKPALVISKNNKYEENISQYSEEDKLDSKMIEEKKLSDNDDRSCDEIHYIVYAPVKEECQILSNIDEVNELQDVVYDEDLINRRSSLPPTRHPF